MEMRPMHHQVPVTESSQPSAARFAARDAADAVGFSEADVHRAGLVATELATNLVKHATGGELLVCGTHGAPDGEVEIVAIDYGPGMADVSHCLADGYSTAGTPGTGLGAVQRLSDDFDIYSESGRGTVVVTRIRARRHRPRVVSPAMLRFAGISVPKVGEPVCGDTWGISHHADGALAIVADGLGHGLLAHEASHAAVSSVDPSCNGDLSRALRTMHDGLRHTRGVAVGLADLRPRNGLMRFAGVGNVSAAVWLSATVRHAVSLNGTIGREVRGFREYSYPWESGAVFVMHSDGLGSRWSLDAYRGLRQRHPSVVAAVLYRDFRRQRDDVTVVVGREAA